jgi:hypothetical protein
LRDPAVAFFQCPELSLGHFNDAPAVGRRVVKSLLQKLDVVFGPAAPNGIPPLPPASAYPCSDAQATSSKSPMT